MHGDAVMPPWPSAFAGAVASRALADCGRAAEVTARPDRAQGILEELLGADYGLTALGLTQRSDALFPLPADLVALPGPRLASIDPVDLGDDFPGLAASTALPALPVLRHPSREKPLGGHWIRVEGLASHLSGGVPSAETLVSTKELWKTDPRLGIALDASSRTAAEGQLYTTDAVALCESVRFLAGFAGTRLPVDGLFA